MLDWQLLRITGLAIDVLGGALFLVLGVALLFIKPRTRASVWFAVFAIPFGIDLIIRNLVLYASEATDPDGFLGAYNFAFGAFWAVSGIGLMGLMRVFPTRTAKDRVWMWGLAATVAITVVAQLILTVLVWDLFVNVHAVSERVPPVPLAISETGLSFFTAAGPIFLWSLALRHTAETSQAARLRGVTLALGPYFVLMTVSLFGWALERDPTRIAWLLLAAPGAFLPFVWLWNANRATSSKDRRGCRNVALMLLSVMTFGTIVMAAVPNNVPWTELGLFGLARILGIVALAYSITKHRLFDLDVKIKWTISRGTVASIFIAVFITIGVVAENFLTDRYGWALGGVSAGLLLFAITPLQRVGERVASAAMPHARPVASQSATERLEMFRAMVTEAWLDGSLSRAESRVLDVARERLGLSLEQAKNVEKVIRG